MNRKKTWLRVRNWALASAVATAAVALGASGGEAARERDREQRSVVPQSTNSAAGGGGQAAPGPASPTAPVSDPAGESRRHGWEQHPADRFRLLAEPTREEMESATAFVREHSPNRFAVLQRLFDGGRIPPRLAGSLVVRYREMMELQRTDKATYELKLKEMRAEDRVFGAVREYRGQGGGGGTGGGTPVPTGEADKLAVVRTAAKDLLDARAQLRQRRINQMKELLSKAEAEHAEEAAHPDMALDRLVQQELTANGLGFAGRRQQQQQQQPRPSTSE